MKVSIVEVKNVNAENIVQFHSEFGEGTAVWNGEIPLAGQEYYAEIEVHGALLWGKDIVESPDECYKIESVPNGLNLVGKIESIDDDGYTVIRLKDSIVCIETLGTPFSIDTFVMIYAGKVELFNQNYN